MKYLKSINENYDNKESINEFLNWDLILDIRDMALEYIDDGFKLGIAVMYIDDIYVATHMRWMKNKTALYIGHYDHNGVSDVHWYNVEKFDCSKIDVDKLSYQINIYPTFDAKYYYNADKTKIVRDEFYSRVKEAYPNENIKINDYFSKSKNKR